MTESTLQSMILGYLNRQPNTFTIKTIKTNARGTPDIIIVYKGFFIFIEVKRPNQRPRPTALQLYTIDQLYRAGARGFITNSYDDFINKYTHLITTLDNFIIS